VNYTKITGTDFSALAGTALAPVTLDSHSWGAALQVGVDVPVTKQVSVNLDVKKVYIQTDVYANGAKAGTLKLDPLLVAVGVGYRF
jgi:outer membrane protein